MDKSAIGFVHPGLMGVSLAASARNSGYTPFWVSKGRSPETRRRAEDQGLTDAGTLEELCTVCSVIISVCPPHASKEVARSVAAVSYRGIYADVNAVSPQHTGEIGEIVARGGAEFVDGGIIGPPAWENGTTWLYLSGVRAVDVAAFFSGGPLEAEVLGTEIGKASALKMCYAANTKGTTALLCAVVAAAENLGVRDELEKQWSRNGSGYGAEIEQRVRRVTAKSWRFAGEMEEISSTLASAGIPPDFHLAARDIYLRLADFKGAADLPSLDEVLAALLRSGQ